MCATMLRRGNDCFCDKAPDRYQPRATAACWKKSTTAVINGILKASYVLICSVDGVVTFEIMHDAVDRTGLSRIGYRDRRIRLQDLIVKEIDTDGPGMILDKQGMRDDKAVAFSKSSKTIWWWNFLHERVFRRFLPLHRGRRWLILIVYLANQWILRLQIDVNSASKRGAQAGNGSN